MLPAREERDDRLRRENMFARARGICKGVATIARGESEKFGAASIYIYSSGEINCKDLRACARCAVSA